MEQNQLGPAPIIKFVDFLFLLIVITLFYLFYVLAIALLFIYIGCSKSRYSPLNKILFNAHRHVVDCIFTIRVLITADRPKRLEHTVILVLCGLSLPF